MGRRATNQVEDGAVADFIRDASVRLGISQERLKIAGRASKELSREELEVMSALAEFARSGASMKRRSALARGIRSAIKAFPKEETKESTSARVTPAASP